MRILIAHNRYREPGGEDEVARAEAAMLRDRGHEVSEFVVDNPPGRFNPWTVHRENVQDLEDEIGKFKPALVHIHNAFFALTPATYTLCLERKLPVVHTAHNYRISCPATTYFRDGKICHECRGKSFAWPGVMHHCYRRSRLKTAFISWNYGGWGGKAEWLSAVKMFIAVGDGVAASLVAAGIDASRIRTKPNFLIQDPGGSEVVGDYALFVGRLTIEKGVHDLLDKWRALQGITLKIAGDGPQREAMKKRIDSEGIRGVEMLGYQVPEKVRELMKMARVVLVPSLWEEAFGLTVIEAFACGRPVLANRAGSLKDLVRDGVNGVLYSAALQGDFEAKLKILMEDGLAARSMGAAARADYETRYTADANYPQLMRIYERALA